MQKYLYAWDFASLWLLWSIVSCSERLCGPAWLCLQGALPKLSPLLIHSSHPVIFWSGWPLLRSTQSNHSYSRFQNATDKTGTQLSFDNTFFSDNGDTIVFLVVIKMLFFSVCIKEVIIWLVFLEEWFCLILFSVTFIFKALISFLFKFF